MENSSSPPFQSHPSPFQSNQPTPNTQDSTSNALQQQLQQSLKSQYEIITKLGSGAYGHVWKVKDTTTQQVFALKKVFSAFQNDVDAQRTYREIYYLQRLSQHQNVVKLKKVIKADNDMDLYLLFQYLQSDLFYGIKEDLLNDMHKKYIIYQLAKCLKYVHSSGLVHRDVKPSNILINPNCEIRLCDFGLSRSLWRYNNQEAKLTQFIATRWYRAPQVLFGSQFYNTKSDMWSVGCLIYELYARRPLLPGNDTVQQIQKVIQFKGFPNTQEKKSFRIPKIQQILSLFDLEKKPLNDYFKHIPSDEVKQILIHLLEYNPQKRWSAVDLLNCSFLQQFREFESQIDAEQQIKTGIHDNQRKSVEVYRNVIYNAFVYDNTKKMDDIKQKLQLIRESRDSLHKNSSGRKNNLRENSHQMLTEQRRSRNLINSKTSASLHIHKTKKPTFSNTQRISHRKNVSAHSNSKFGSDVLDTQKPPSHKTLLSQMKVKKQPKFDFSLNPTTRKTVRNSENKQKQSKQLPTTRPYYPQYLRSSTHASVSKMPKMIQQKLNQQRCVFGKSSAENSKSSKLLRTSMHSKQKKSPYVMHLEESMSKFDSAVSTPMGKSSMLVQSLNGTKNLKENMVGVSHGVRKLKRKGVVN